MEQQLRFLVGLWGGRSDGVAGPSPGGPPRRVGPLQVSQVASSLAAIILSIQSSLALVKEGCDSALSLCNSPWVLPSMTKLCN